MTKPVIVKRLVKASSLTYEEHDTNFQNLADATVTLRAGTGGTNVVSDLNGTITLVAGVGIALSGNNTAKTVTITNTGINTFSNQLVFATGAADSAPGQLFTADRANGAVQRIQFETGNFYRIGVPVNMTAGQDLTLLIYNPPGFSAAGISLDTDPLLLISRGAAGYFETESNTSFTVTSTGGWFSVRFVSDGEFFWTTVNSQHL